VEAVVHLITVLEQPSRAVVVVVVVDQERHLAVVVQAVKVTTAEAVFQEPNVRQVVAEQVQPDRIVTPTYLELVAPAHHQVLLVVQWHMPVVVVVADITEMAVLLVVQVEEVTAQVLVVFQVTVELI
jgi:hypothetical protein